MPLALPEPTVVDNPKKGGPCLLVFQLFEILRLLGLVVIVIRIYVHGFDEMWFAHSQVNLALNMHNLVIC